ncbi:hypothetical protein BGX28_006875 [Mortierella sp. GBA30]|nr:hypothetical protein BGX28_006875 [Mortierella sp. GBA30]
MDWFVLAGAAAEAVSQVLVVVACGVILSRTGYLSQSAQKIASTISWEQFKAFWPIPVFYLFFSSVSWLLARAGSRLLRFSADEEKFVTASILFSNTNSLPMALVQSLALSAAGTRLLRDEQDTKEQVAARGISYILFYAIFGNLVRWSYGFSLLVPKTKGEDGGNQPQHESDLSSQDRVQQSVPASSVADASTSPREGVLIDVDELSTANPSTAIRAATVKSSASSTRTMQAVFEPYRDDTDDEQTEDEGDEVDEPRRRLSLEHTPFFRSSRSKKQHQRATHLQPLSPPIVDTQMSMPASGYAQQRQHSHQHHQAQSHQHPRLTTGAMFKTMASTALDRIRQVLTPPLLTAMIALTIGLVPQLHSLFMSPESKVYAFIIHPLESCGAAAIPMILLCLGAQVIHFASNTAPSAEPNSKATSASTRSGSVQQCRQTVNTPSAFPNAYQACDSASSDNDGEDDGEETEGRDHRGWLGIQGHPSRARNNTYGQGGIASTRSYASSTTTLFHTEGGFDDGEDELPSSGSPSGYRFKHVTPVVYALFARMVLVPLISLPAIIFHPDTLSPVLTMDPTFSLTLVLLVSAPTAINMIQLCQIKGFFEKEMAGHDLYAQANKRRQLWIDQAKSTSSGETRVAIVTGGNTGLGYETAKALVESGFTTIIACRSVNKGQEAIDRIEAETDIKGMLSVLPLDLSSQESVKVFTHKFKSLGFSQLDVLVNNAGMMDIPFGLTKEGYEMQFGVNHLGHYVLTLELLPLLKNAIQGRIVVLSSGALFSSDNIRYDLLQSPKGYSRLGHYSYSKLANMLFVKALNRRLQQAAESDSSIKITVNAAHPGACSTELFRHNPMMNLLMVPARIVCRSPLMGAMTSIYLAIAPGLEGVSGEYFFDQIPRTVNPIAMDEKAQELLWAKSVEFTGVDFKL